VPIILKFIIFKGFNALIFEFKRDYWGNKEPTGLEADPEDRSLHFRHGGQNHYGYQKRWSSKHQVCHPL